MEDKNIIIILWQFENYAFIFFFFSKNRPMIEMTVQKTKQNACVYC